MGIVGVVAGALAVALCGRVLAREWGRVEDRLADADPALLVAALGAAAATMWVVATGWVRILGTPRRATLRWYFVGELGKYVPGLVWPVIGRAELAVRGGVDRKVAYRSVVVSLAAWYGSLAAPITSRILKVPVARYAWSWLGVAATSVLAAAALDVGGSAWRIGLAAVVAWYAGFLAVPVPAGAGVREGVFAAVAGLPGPEAVAVAVVARLCFVAVDLSAAGIAGATQRRTAPSNPL